MVESSRGSGRALLRGVAEYAHYFGPWSFYWEPSGLQSTGPALHPTDADGIIMRDGDRLDEILALERPTVVVGHNRNEVAGVANVVTDSPAVAQLAADHLMQRGFRHFAFVGFGRNSRDQVFWSRIRHRAFHHYVAKAGYQVRVHTLRLTPGRSWAREREALARWLKTLPLPLGLMACNDDCGVQVMEACQLAGLAVPDQIGVIAADNDEIVCGLANPAMSSVAINFQRGGYEAAEALDRLMRGARNLPARITVPATHVVTRRSTDIVAIPDEPVARALRFIRENSNRPIPVSDVASAAALSRRALEQRFRREVGCSILDQIRRERTDRISRLLVETTMPVGEIADTLGFEDAQHFARYFRAAKSLSPVAYRKSFGKPVARRRAQIGESFAQTGVESADSRPENQLIVR